MVDKIISSIKQKLSIVDAWFLLLIVFCFSLLKIPSLVEPYWYGDEGIYEVIGMAVRSGRVLYQGIWDNKPPLLYLIYALFNGDQFSVRFLSLLFGVAAVIAFFFLAKKLFSNNRSVYLSTIIYGFLFGLPILEGNIANAENFMHFPIILAFYIILSSYQKKNLIPFFISGVLLSLAFLTKIVAVFDFGALFLTILILKFYEGSLLRINYRKIFTGFTQEVFFSLGFVLPILLSIIYFFTKGALSDYFRAAFFQNVGYVGSGNYFLFPMGWLVIKLFLLGLSTLLILKFRKKIGVNGVLIFLWLFFSVFNALFSAKPWTHYLLVMVPSFSLLLGLLIDSKKISKITIPIFLITFYVVLSNFKFYGKNLAYYSNYFQFVFGNKSVDDYQSFFDRITPRDYSLAKFILMNTKPSDSIFLWSDSGQIYALTGKLPPGRYIVAYHVTFFKNAIEETKKDLARVQPKFIIQTKDSPEINNYLASYSLRYKIQGARIYERKL